MRSASPPTAGRDRGKSAARDRKDRYAQLGAALCFESGSWRCAARNDERGDEHGVQNTHTGLHQLVTEHRAMHQPYLLRELKCALDDGLAVVCGRQSGDRLVRVRERKRGVVR